MFYYWKTQWCLKISSCCSIQGRWERSQHRLCYCIAESTPLPLGSLLGITSLGLCSFGKDIIFPSTPLKWFSPRCCSLILCKDTLTGRRKGGGLGAGEVGGSGELREGCVLGMLHGLRVEGEETECQYHRGEGISVRLRSTYCFHQTPFLSLVPSFSFSLLGPQIFPWSLGPQKCPLTWSQMGEACSGDPFCSNMDTSL